MRISWSIHLYPPKHNCGSEWMAHNINKFLVKQGHEVRVILHQAHKYKIKVPYIFDGVEVTGPTHRIEQYQWPDVLLTHLEYTGHTLPLGHLSRRPVIQFVHGNKRYQSIENAKHARVVYNSQWIADELQYKWQSMVFNPFCDYDFINVNDNPINNEYITLVNLNENKGANVFYEIAKAMPGRKFLGVIGGYDDQIIKKLPNVTIVPNAKDIREYYKQTRIILMPSELESWGMVATEAMCNGIPVISSRTPGLVENCADAALYVQDRNNVSEWVNLIECLDNPGSHHGGYQYHSFAGRARAKELCNVERLYKLETFLYESLSDYRDKRR
jgi:glycosyltransferase involved in cell wall biosynthesis